MNSTETYDSLNYGEIGYQGVMMLVVVVNLVASLSVHFRFKSLCESDVVKRMFSLSSLLQRPQPLPQNNQNLILSQQSSI